MKIIEVNNLSKSYKIGHRKEGYLSLRDELVNLAKKPVWWLKGQREKKEFFWALKDVNFSVEEGEVMGIIGKNGAGKSTLLKILSRITPPTAGEAIIRGRVSSLLEVGTGFHPELTGRENIFLNGAILGMAKREISSKFDKIVEFAGLEKFLDTPVKRYSSGMYVRLAFAVTAHLEPEILLVDEVLAVGDYEFQKKCLKKMDEVSKGAGRTILFVSHNIAAIQSLCQRCILLDRGEIKMIGAVRDVVERYLDMSASRTGLKCWDENEAPGDENAKLKSIRLCSSSGDTRSEFGTDEPIYVEIKYKIFKKLFPFRIGFALDSSDGMYMFYTSDDDMPTRQGMRQPGEYMSCCQIPANWLNTGSYYVGIEGGIFGVSSIFKNVPNLEFTIISTGGPTSRFSEKRRGVLCPALDWEVIIKNV